MGEASFADADDRVVKFFGIKGMALMGSIQLLDMLMSREVRNGIVRDGKMKREEG